MFDQSFLTANIPSDRRFLTLLGGAHWASRTTPTSWVDIPDDGCEFCADFVGGALDLTTRDDAFAHAAKFNRERTEKLGGDPVDMQWAIVIEVGQVMQAPGKFTVMLSGVAYGVLRQDVAIRIVVVRPTDEERRRYAIAADELAGAGV